MRRRVAILLVAVTAVLVTVASALAASDGSGTLEGAQPAGEVDCRPGALPANDYGSKPPEAGFRYEVRPVVLGCGELASGQRLQLVGYRYLAPRQRSAICVDTVEIPNGLVSGCGSADVLGGGPIDARGSRTGGGAPARVSGATASNVASVTLRYELDGRLTQTPAVLIRVRSGALLRRLRVARAFGNYISEVPAGARAVTAEARDARGRLVGVAAFEQFAGPRGEGRLCYGLLRITRVSYLGRRSPGARGTLRVDTTYPGGSVAGVMVRTDNGAAEIVEVIRSQRARRSVRVPVRLGRNRTTVFDVNADGFPTQDDDCDDQRRRAAPRTLIVRAS